jgi:chromate transporter
MDTPPAASKERVPLLALMGVTARIGITSFGGSTAAWLYAEIVEKRHWLDEEGFLTALTLSQVLPGANPVNLSIYVGSQLRGAWGAVAAAFGMIAPPFIIILVLGFFYSAYGHTPVAHAILAGLAAVGVGMTLSIGAKLVKKVMQPVPALIAVVIFVTVGILHWPMIPVVLVLTPASIFWFWLQKRRSAA